MAKTSSTQSRHVALLRGINVGGKNRVPMKDLVALFERAGCTDVQTYIQSGNVVFSASAAVASTVAEAVSAALKTKLGVSSPVVTRTAAQVEAVARGNPFLKAGSETDVLHVAFLQDRPTAAAVAALDANRSPPDTFEVVGQDIFLRCPEGFARTKLTNAYFDSKLKTVSTVRNWRTVAQLLSMVSD